MLGDEGVKRDDDDDRLNVSLFLAVEEEEEAFIEIDDDGNDGLFSIVELVLSLLLLGKDATKGVDDNNGEDDGDDNFLLFPMIPSFVFNDNDDDGEGDLMILLLSTISAAIDLSRSCSNFLIASTFDKYSILVAFNLSALWINCLDLIDIFTIAVFKDKSLLLYSNVLSIYMSKENKGKEE